MKIGVTGTRSGMNEHQKTELINFMRLAFAEASLTGEGAEVHHGDCVGVDVEFAELAKELGFKTICHPPEKDELRAFHKSDEIRQPKSYFARNRNIVDECDLLIVIPYQDSHQKSGGTWYTYDYAVKKQKPTHVIFPMNESQ
jgi:hypothetical protein